MSWDVEQQYYWGENYILLQYTQTPWLKPPKLVTFISKFTPSGQWLYMYIPLLVFAPDTNCDSD